MRAALIGILAMLGACATAGGALPMPRYADAASRGALASVLAGRPSEEQVRLTTDNWSYALADSLSCGVPMRQVLDAGLVGALEISAMNAAAHNGGEREIRAGARAYLSALVGLLTQRREAPAAQRCRALEGWAPRTAEAGREAVARARANGLMDEEYGLLFDLLAR
ncbi:MAG: hypothetical protein JNK94_08815 [Hyphomonadaceae bacterium]|nr:hypothetical protein [Hyphomonadaceae bacterium]